MYVLITLNVVLPMLTIELYGNCETIDRNDKSSAQAK